MHAVALALVVGFVALGWWQLDVYRQTEQRQETRDSAPVAISDVAQPGRALGEAADHPVTASGTYTGELAVPARVHEGVLGAYAVGLLETPDGIVTVLRGWEHDADALPSPPAGDVTVTGHLVDPETAAEATGRATLDDGEVGYLAPDAVARAATVDPSRLYDGYLLLSAEDPPPTAAPERLDVATVAPIRHVGPWQNLSYWAQWWVFAGAVVVFWVSLVRSAVRKREESPAPDDQQQPAPRPSVPR